MYTNIANVYECMIIHCIWKIIPDFKTDLERLEKKIFEMSKLDKI